MLCILVVICVSQWTVAEVGHWLCRFPRLAPYHQLFESNFVNGEIIFSSDMDDLRHLGLKHAERRSILKELTALDLKIRFPASPVVRYWIPWYQLVHRFWQIYSAGGA